MLIVADSSALIALATCDGLDILVQLYDDIKVPEAVFDEIVTPEKAQSDTLGSLSVGASYARGHNPLGAGGRWSWKRRD